MKRFGPILLAVLASAVVHAQTHTVVTYEGAWSSTPTYVKSAVVTEAGSTYVSVQSGNINHDPAADTGHTWWAPLPGGTTFNGGTVANPITLPADPAQNLQAATKQYVDAHTGTFNGGAVANPITLPADPTQALNAATKQYTDTRAASVNRPGASINLSQGADTGGGDRHFFDLRNVSEFDATSGTAVFAAGGSIGGSFQGNRTFAQGQSMTSYTLQCKMYFSSTGTLTYMGTTADGTIGGATYGPAFFGGNFVFFNNGAPTTLSSSFASNAWYWVTYVVNEGFGTVTVQSVGTTLGTKTFLTGTMPAATNIKIQTAANADLISQLRYAADNVSGSSPLFPNRIMVAAADGAGNHSTVMNLTVTSNPSGSSVNTVVVLPPNYRPGTQSPWVLWDHGAGGSASEMFGTLSNPMAEALSQAGYVLVASDYSLQNCWGNANCGLDIAAVMQQAQLYFNLAPNPYVYMGSMGGIVTLNAIAHGYLHPRAIEGVFPVYSLAGMYNSGSGTYASSIQTAYGFGAPSGYAAATSGYDPALDSISTFASIPMDIHCSAGDTVVNCASNGQAIAAAINAAGGTAQFTPCTGDHGDPSCMAPSAAIEFFRQH